MRDYLDPLDHHRSGYEHNQPFDDRLSDEDSIQRRGTRSSTRNLASASTQSWDYLNPPPSGMRGPSSSKLVVQTTLPLPVARALPGPQHSTTWRYARYEVHQEDEWIQDMDTPDPIPPGVLRTPYEQQSNWSHPERSGCVGLDTCSVLYLSKPLPSIPQNESFRERLFRGLKELPEIFRGVGHAEHPQRKTSSSAERLRPPQPPQLVFTPPLPLTSPLSPTTASSPPQSSFHPVGQRRIISDASSSALSSTISLARQAASYYDPSLSGVGPVRRFFVRLYRLPWVSPGRVTVDYRPNSSNRSIVRSRRSAQGKRLVQTTRRGRISPRQAEERTWVGAAQEEPERRRVAEEADRKQIAEEAERKRIAESEEAEKKQNATTKNMTQEIGHNQAIAWMERQGLAARRKRGMVAEWELEADPPSQAVEEEGMLVAVQANTSMDGEEIPILADCLVEGEDKLAQPECLMEAEQPGHGDHRREEVADLVQADSGMDEEEASGQLHATGQETEDVISPVPPREEEEQNKISQDETAPVMEIESHQTGEQPEAIAKPAARPSRKSEKRKQSGDQWITELSSEEEAAEQARLESERKAQRAKKKMARAQAAANTRRSWFKKRLARDGQQSAHLLIVCPRCGAKFSPPHHDFFAAPHPGGACCSQPITTYNRGDVTIMNISNMNNDNSRRRIRTNSMKTGGPMNNRFLRQRRT